MAKKEKKEAKAPVAKKEKKVMTPEEKAAKKAARMEAIKNRPEGQRTNSKQVDVIDLGDGKVIKNFGYPVKQKNQHIGVLVTSVALNNGEVTSTSISFIPGDLTVKAKKGHGTIIAAKHKGEPDTEDEEVEDVEDADVED
jgi:hypothetical protein